MPFAFSPSAWTVGRALATVIKTDYVIMHYEHHYLTFCMRLLKSLGCTPRRVIWRAISFLRHSDGHLY